MFITDPNRDLGSEFKAWWRDLPIWSTFIFLSTITTSIVMLFYPPLLYLIFSTDQVIHTYSFWQFITYPYICPSLLSAAFSLCAYMPRAPKKERLLGTFRFILYFTLQNILIALLSIPLYYLFISAGVDPQFYFMKLFLFGLWPSIMLEMVLESNISGDDAVPFMCFPIMIKKKWYPWLFFLFFAVLFGIVYSLLLGIIAGYFYLWNLMKWSEVSNRMAAKWEVIFCCLRSFRGYVSVDDSGNELPALRPVSVNIQMPPSAPTVAFSGTGYRLGGDEGGSSFNAYFKSQNPGK